MLTLKVSKGSYRITVTNNMVLELKDNTVIFEYVQQYIRESKRFL
jgi:hypothetical protein